MKVNEIYTAFVAWPGGGKRRPILIVDAGAKCFTFFSITSQYDKKSKFIQRRYYPLSDWQKEGLRKPSYVDAGPLLNLSTNSVELLFVGQLTRQDKIGLARFIKDLPAKFKE